MRFVRTAENLFGLPLGFTRVEYLQSSGTQYIDTGYIASNTSGFQVDIMPLQATDKYFIGSRPRTVTNDRWLAGSNTGPQVYIGWNTNTFVNWELNKVHTVQNNFMNSRTKVLDGTVVAQISETLSSQGTRTVYLFSANDATAVSMDTCRIYKVQISDGSSLVRDFIPCIDPLGVPCMYDLVGKKPYYNAGTGTFTVGRQVIPVEYLQSSGTQYIDTGIACSTTLKIQCISEQTNTSDGAVFGCGTNNGSNDRVQGYWSSQRTSIRMDGTVYDSSSAPSSKQKITFLLDTQNKKGYINGTEYISNYTGSVSDRAIWLFGRNVGGTIVNLDKSSSKIYQCIIWDNGVLVRDFIPCKDENNVGFMFDTLSGTVYLNAGTGAFSVGENKYTSKLRLIKDAKELPDGYKRIEYLQSDGNQYIDTEYTINTATDEVSFNFQMISTTKYQWIMGEHDDGARFGVGVGDGTNLRNIAYGATTYKVNDTEVYNSIHYFKANSNGVYLNGVQVHGFESFSSSSTVYLFKLNLSGSNGAAGKIWRYVQKRNGILIRDMIPCLDPNNTPCMFDLVGGKPYYNLGTGDFTYGHTITPVEYLESTGTQYINTGIKLDNNSSVELDYQLTQAVQNRKGLFGGLDTGGSKRFGALLSPSNNQLEGGYGSGNEFYQLGLPDTNRHIMKQEKNLLYFDGSLVYTFNTATFTQSFNAPLGNFSYTNYNPASAKYYRSKWWDNGTLVRSFIPVRDENNVGYMFDEVTGQLFGNAGSGSFGIGNDLKTQKVRFIQDVLPREYRPLKYIQSTGTQYIDTGVNAKSTLKTDIHFEVVDKTQGGHIFGGRTVTSGGRGYGVYLPTSGGIGFDYETRLSSNVSTTNGYKYRVVKDGASNTLYVNGVQSYTGNNTAATFNLNVAIALFYMKDSNTSFNASVKCKVFYFKIYDGGVPVRDLYPALRKSDNKPGMYDRITKQFFTNAATSGNDFNYE